MLRIALSHDIDRTRKTYQFFTKPLRALSKARFGEFWSLLSTSFKAGNYWTFEDIIKIESDFNVKSTFFFLNESIKFNFFQPKSFKLSQGRYNIKETKIVNLIKWLDENGWEIGVHGSYNSYKKLEFLKDEKETLQNILGHEVIGIRQHYLNLNQDTWKKQHALGFKYDSSLGFTRDIGFKDNKIQPFQPLNNDFTIIPLVIMDTCFMTKKNHWDELDKLFNVCEKENAILVVNFHNHVFNKKEYPGYREAYIKIIEKGIERRGDFRTLSEHYKNINKKIVLKTSQ